MISDVANHLWQSTLFAAAAGLVVLALRRNGAHIRHAVWLAASLKFLLPFSLLIGAGALAARPPARVTGSVLTAPASAVFVDQIAEPFPDDLAGMPASPATQQMPLATMVTVAWGAGFLAVLLLRLNAWRRVRAALRSSTRVSLRGVEIPPGVEVRTSPALLEPGIVGIWQPVLLLPAEIDAYLTPAQLEGVVAHELCHVRRRDNLAASFQMVVETLFWFYPLVWWIGARLVDERERACDEHVLNALDEPRDYADGILAICRRYVESPLECVSGVTGRASGTHLRQRIEAIMTKNTGTRLNRSRQLALMAAIVLAAIAPIAAGVVTAPLRKSQQTTLAKKFDVASIKACEQQPVPPGGRSGGGNGSFSPGYAHLNCFVVSNLVGMAHVNNRDSKSADDPLEQWPMPVMARQANGEPGRVRGGPAWVYTDKYTIEAKAEGLDPSTGNRGGPNNDRTMMLGPMLRALLEDRFKLKVHVETEQAPMWALTVAKSGLKLKPLPPDGDCVKWDSAKGSPPGMDEQILRAKRGEKRICGFGVMGGMIGPNNAVAMTSQTMSGIARLLSTYMDRFVVDKTGINGNFNVYLEFAPDTSNSMFFNARETADNTGTPTAPIIFKALEEQLGLKLEPTTGSRGYLKIDHIERPTPDLPAQPPARAKGAGR
jgi:bla regulator protein blaR1